MKRYVAESTSSGVEVLVQNSEMPGDTTSLRSLRAGFEWGYEGEGPRCLAHAILSDVVADRFCESFMKEVVSKTSPIEKHDTVVVFHEKDVLDWLRAKLCETEERA